MKARGFAVDTTRCSWRDIAIDDVGAALGDVCLRLKRPNGESLLLRMSETEARDMAGSLDDAADMARDERKAAWTA